MDVTVCMYAMMFSRKIFRHGCSRSVFLLQLSLCYVWIVSDSGWKCEVWSRIGTIEDDDGEVDRDELLSETLPDAVRARTLKLWHFYP